MKKVLKIFGLTLITIVIFIVILMIFLPSKVLVERTLTVNADARIIYRFLNNLQNFRHWSYWSTIDSQTTYTFTGPYVGVGSRMNWLSENPQMGKGSLWIIDAEPGEYINSKVLLNDFDNPAIFDFEFSDSGESTEVTLRFMSDFYGYWKFFVPMMEDELGPAFEIGLKNIKRIIENNPNYKIEISLKEESIEFNYVGIKMEILDNQGEDYVKWSKINFAPLSQYVQSNNVDTIDYPICFLHDFDGNFRVLEPAFKTSDWVVVNHQTIESNSRDYAGVVQGLLAEGDISMPDAHQEIWHYIDDHQLEIAGSPWLIFTSSGDSLLRVSSINYPVMLPVN